MYAEEHLFTNYAPKWSQIFKYVQFLFTLELGKNVLTRSLASEDVPLDTLVKKTAQETCVSHFLIMFRNNNNF